MRAHNAEPRGDPVSVELLHQFMRLAFSRGAHDETLIVARAEGRILRQR